MTLTLKCHKLHNQKHKKKQTYNNQKLWIFKINAVLLLIYKKKTISTKHKFKGCFFFFIFLKIKQMMIKNLPLVIKYSKEYTELSKIQTIFIYLKDTFQWQFTKRSYSNRIKIKGKKLFKQKKPLWNAMKKMYNLRIFMDL